jgi:hypothetical protein
VKLAGNHENYRSWLVFHCLAAEREEYPARE